MAPRRRRGGIRPLANQVQHFLQLQGLYHSEISAAFGQIRSGRHTNKRLPRIIAYAIRQEKFVSTLRLTDSMDDTALRQVLYQGLSFYVSDAPWPEQVAYVAHRLLRSTTKVSAQTQLCVVEAKKLDAAADREAAQRRIVQRARLTRSARPSQLELLRDVGWDSAAVWLNRQPFAISSRNSDNRVQRRAQFSPQEVEAPNLPRVNFRTSSTINKVKNSPRLYEADALPEQSSPTGDIKSGALVLFNEDLFAKLKASLKHPRIRIISADTYFLAESLSVHERWLLAFPNPLWILSTLVIDEAELLTREKGLVINLWYRSNLVDRVNLRLPDRRQKILLHTDLQRALGFILLYVFSGNLRLKKSSDEAGFAIAKASAKTHFHITSIYRIMTAGKFAEMAVHAGFAGTLQSFDLPQQEIRGYLRRRNGNVHRVRPHRKGV